MGINFEFLKAITKDRANRKEDWQADRDLKSQIWCLAREIRQFIIEHEKYKKHDIAAILISLYRWKIADFYNRRRLSAQPKEKSKPRNYDVRELVYVDFGGVNFGIEASYEHPAVVLHNGYYFLLVIPGSTGRVGKSDFILTGSEKDGFAHETGVQVDQIRVIDKSRVIKSTGKKVSIELMYAINDCILQHYLSPTYRKMKKLEEEIVHLKQELSEYQSQELEVKS